MLNRLKLVEFNSDTSALQTTVDNLLTSLSGPLITMFVLMAAGLMIAAIVFSFLMSVKVNEAQKYKQKLIWTGISFVIIFLILVVGWNLIIGAAKNIRI